MAKKAWSDFAITNYKCLKINFYTYYVYDCKYIYIYKYIVCSKSFASLSYFILLQNTSVGREKSRTFGTSCVFLLLYFILLIQYK